MQHKHPKYLQIKDYSYHLPEDRIAHYPMEERDLSKLLVYNNGEISEDVYRNVSQYLSPGSLVIFNQTKVVQVRLLFQKDTGAGIEIFCLEPDKRYADMQTAMTQRGEVYWLCLVGGANKWKKDTVLKLYNESLDIHIEAHLADRLDGMFLICLKWKNEEISFAEVLQAIGKVPLPPYMNREMKEEDKERYQTIYAKEEGSVAAPTAGLHFTSHIFESFVENNIHTSFLTLHVGAGTFKQVKTEKLEEHQMHAEWIEVSLEFIEQLLRQNGSVVAVGTTSIRTIESLYWIGLKLYLGMPVQWGGNAVEQWDAYELDAKIDAKIALQQLAEWMHNRQMNKLITRTQILIAPGYHPKIVNKLITNFHQPDSTLLLLIAALVGENWKSIYNYALNNNFRFLSYGDGCLISIKP
ncbi:MAG: S-adenosylmethionine:tRNA ribosyltransferase-isomerase [Chitinophagaceae bacterium]